MAALLRVADDAEARSLLGVDSMARVMLNSSEGAAGESGLFERATGLTVDAAMAMAPR
jgi:hypothetical protein